MKTSAVLILLLLSAACSTPAEYLPLYRTCRGSVFPQWQANQIRARIEEHEMKGAPPKYVAEAVRLEMADILLRIARRDSCEKIVAYIKGYHSYEPK